MAQSLQNKSAKKADKTSAEKTAIKTAIKAAAKKSAKKSVKKSAKKKRGLFPDHDLEHVLLDIGSPEQEHFIFGLDEVGRGCLAGPVVAACSAYRTGLVWPEFPAAVEINDSKLLDYSQRKQSQIFLEATALIDLHVGEASVAEIDEINILHASGLAMFRAFEKVWRQLKAQLGRNPQNYSILIDGNYVPQKFRGNMLESRVKTLVKGDQRSFAIAAAAIFAKNHRDEFMWELARKHPGYGWETNVGYSSPLHKRGLVAQGFTEWHRRSFSINLDNVELIEVVDESIEILIESDIEA